MPKLTHSGELRILDFDIENRPLSYGGPDFTFSDITAIAASWEGENEIHVFLQRQWRTDAQLERGMKRLLLGFKKLYDQAHLVTGHYIRRHDLPIINGALIEFGLPSLGPKLTIDTKEDLVKRSGISAAQENLSEMFGLEAGKYHMSQPKWRHGNRLTVEGLEQTRRRVVDDVRQHKELRRALLDRGLLGAPKLWRP